MCSVSNPIYCFTIDTIFIFIVILTWAGGIFVVGRGLKNNNRIKFTRFKRQFWFNQRLDGVLKWYGIVCKINNFFLRDRNAGTGRDPFCHCRSV